MQYLLMIYDEEKQFAKIPQEGMGKMLHDYGEFTEGIVRGGQFRAGARLQPVTTATTLREKGGKVVALDGPFAETKEQLGGYYLVECKDLDEAMAVAKRIPSLRFGGSVEVRPIAPMSEAPRTPPAK